MEASLWAGCGTAACGCGCGGGLMFPSFRFDVLAVSAAGYQVPALTMASRIGNHGYWLWLLVTLGTRFQSFAQIQEKSASAGRIHEFRGVAFEGVGDIGGEFAGRSKLMFLYEPFEKILLLGERDGGLTTHCAALHQTAVLTPIPLSLRLLQIPFPCLLIQNPTPPRRLQNYLLLHSPSIFPLNPASGTTVAELNPALLLPESVFRLSLSIISASMLPEHSSASNARAPAR